MTKDAICMTPGPIEFESRVLNAFAAEGISHVDPQVIEIFGQCLEKLRHVFLAPDGQPMIVTGSGTLGWDMVAANLINQNDNVLVVNTGYFGDHLGDCLSRYGAQVTYFRSPIGAQPSVVTFKELLSCGVMYKAITFTHVDTSTGVRLNLQQLTNIARSIQPSAILIVDGVCSAGGEELRMTDWDIDVVLTGSQKCIGVPAGLSLLMIRSRALKAAKESTFKSKYYVDWNKWLPIMKSYEARQPCYFATPAVNHLFALNEGLNILLENGGMESRFKEHQAIGTAIKKAVQSLGCKTMTEDDAGANTMTCVLYPDGVDGKKFLPEVKKHGIALAGGLHPAVKTKYFRIGHMGPSTRRLDHVLKTLQASQKALVACGHYVPVGGLEEATSIVKNINTDNKKTNSE